ncbi:cobyric acid synthase [Bacillus solimangrovi]|uniref:Cobyric acid synthase n=1 Tax=Bacillus solimangrovi TaxID=1305675 RepID=A0A1E5LJE2_9BACI|nr:cobyric acid synthase [Bacillus solimangrovi]OEH94213.1 cobyric acid synthase CobQ [Bacillus solimangrovi]
MKRKAKSLMIQGTHSDAGKSVLVAAFCRIFNDKGYETAPFKSQNMALNSYITIDGKEIGRAQGVQAEAARVEATVQMNPILIKPSSDSRSQIVVYGKPYQNMEAFNYRKHFYDKGVQIIHDSFAQLSETYERIVIEGAGSPAEVNLNDREIVNMKVAEIADAPVILVGDIERGGVFASLVGTLQLLSEHDRKRVIGVIINKFRGDISLLENGLTWFEEYTGVPVLGVIPYLHGLNIDAEDSVVLDTKPSGLFQQSDLDIVVLRLPYISNFTDIDPFFLEDDCDVRYVSKSSHFGDPDLVIIPGSKSTIADLQFLHDSGLANCVKEAAQKETMIIGICGGYQMLGQIVEDPYEVESVTKQAEGLALFPIKTTMAKEKRTVRSTGELSFDNLSFQVEGYEIHMGQTDGDGKGFITMHDHQDGKINHEETIVGTYFHGLFHNDRFRHHLLNTLRNRKGLAPIQDRTFYDELREDAYNKLADHVRTHVDIERIETIMETYSS